MPVTSDIVASYRTPRLVLRRHLSQGVREDRALMFLMLSCLLIFVAQLPRLSREATLDAERDLAPLAGAELFVWLIVAPLFFYGLAAVSHLIARALGGRGTWYRARLALFWSLLVTTPLWLLRGLVAAFLGPGVPLELTGLLAFCAFGVVWFVNLREAESGPGDGSEVQGA
jgi:succinate dehydrogenase/fumarate reductase cytochrome b subunit